MLLDQVMHVDHLSRLFTWHRYPLLHTSIQGEACMLHTHIHYIMARVEVPCSLISAVTYSYTCTSIYVGRKVGKSGKGKEMGSFVRQRGRQ